MLSSVVRFGLAAALLASVALAQEKGKWVNITEGPAGKIAAEFGTKKPPFGWPTAGVAVDPASGDLYVVFSDHGLHKSADQGATFERVDGKTVGGRCETGYALNFDPAGKRLMCFMIYGSSARTDDAGKTFAKSGTSHLDFGAVDWEDTGKTMLSFRHEKAGMLCLTTDAGATWKDLDKGFKGLGVIDSKTLLATKGAGILRSTDAGATWETVSDAKVKSPTARVFKGVAYWAADKGFVISRDQGKTWTPEWTVDAVHGPWFGKTADHVMVVGSKGFHESRDGGKTWTVVAPLPTGFTVGLVGPNYAWDPHADIFYASSMGKHTFQFRR